MIIWDEVKNLKIVQINTLGATLSTGRTTREMHNYLNANGINSHIVCPAPLDCNDAFFFSTRNRMRFDVLLSIITGLDGYHSKIPTRKLIHFLDEVKPDIVHLRVIHSNCINLKILLEYLAIQNIATVITLHDFWFLTGKCCFFTVLDCKKWKSGCYKCPAIKRAAYPSLFDRSKKMWKDKKRLLTNIPKLAVIGVSDWVVAEAKQSFLKDAKIIHRVYNWIDLSIFYPRNASGLRKQMRMEDTFIVLGVSAVWESGDRKGLDHFIKLAINIPNNYRIILIGSINYTEKIPENIVIIPKVNDADLLAQYFSLADVFLNLSLEETFGKVSAEALACGTPIIAIDSTANKELVPAGGGIVLPVLKIGSIIRALKEIEANTKSSYQNTCRNFAIKNFNLNNNINQYLDIYKRLLDE